MRLNNYLIEAKKKKKNKDLTPIQLIKKIQKECSQIIRVYESTNRVFYRGVKSYQQWWNPKKVRIRSRIPKDTPKGTHDWLNYYFKEKFGWPGRNGVMATPNAYTADYYAESNRELVFVFLPVNKYKFIYNPDIGDLYDSLPGELKHLFVQSYDDAEMVAQHLQENMPLNWKAFMKKFKKYTDKNLKQALKQGVEVMFKPKEYYLIPLHDEFNGYPFEAEDILGFQPIH